MVGTAEEVSMSVKSQRIKDVLFGKGTAVFEAYMAGRHLQARVGCMSRARISTEMGIRRMWVDMARDDHHKFLKCVAKIAQLERV
jgi:hypothetical protein